MHEIPETLALLRPDDLFPVWCLVDSLEHAGRMPAEDAVRWKHWIYRLMMFWRLEPDDLVQAPTRGVRRGWKHLPVIDLRRAA